MSPEVEVMMDQIKAQGWEIRRVEELSEGVYSLLNELETDAARAEASWMFVRVWHAILNIDGTVANLLCGGRFSLPVEPGHMHDALYMSDFVCTKCRKKVLKYEGKLSAWRREDLRRVGGDRSEKK